MGEKKIGRPTDNPKDIVLKIRLDHDTSEKLEECREKMETSKAEVVRQGIIKMHDDLKK
jgi:predicted transcriptional regulator